MNWITMLDVFKFLYFQKATSAENASEESMETPTTRTERVESAEGSFQLSNPTSSLSPRHSPSKSRPSKNVAQTSSGRLESLRSWKFGGKLANGQQPHLKYRLFELIWTFVVFSIEDILHLLRFSLALINLYLT
jgi:hypothetical protein